MPILSTPAQSVGPATSSSGTATLAAYSATSVNSGLILYVINGGSATTPSVSDTQGNTWILVVTSSRTGNRCDIFYCSSPSTGSNTITVTVTGGGSTVFAYLEEWTGVPNLTSATGLYDTASGFNVYTANGTATTSPGGSSPETLTSVGNTVGISVISCASAISGLSVSPGTLGAATTRGGTAYVTGNGIRASVGPVFSWTTSRAWAQASICLMPGGIFGFPAMQ